MCQHGAHLLQSLVVRAQDLPGGAEVHAGDDGLDEAPVDGGVSAALLIEGAVTRLVLSLCGDLWRQDLWSDTNMATQSLTRKQFIFTLFGNMYTTDLQSNLKKMDHDFYMGQR